MLKRLMFIVSLASLATPANAGMQELYGTREPLACGPFQAMSGATLSNDEAARIYQCAFERDAMGMASTLFLIEDLAVQVGRPRPFGQVADYNLRDADPSRDVYPIRGTLTKVQCETVNDMNRGENCYEYPSRGEGICYVNTFDEWQCPMFLTDAGEWRPRVPPRR